MSLKESALIFTTTVFMCYMFLYSNLSRDDSPNQIITPHSQIKTQITITKTDTRPKINSNNLDEEDSFGKDSQELMDYFEEEDEYNKKFNKVKTKVQNRTYSLLNSLMKTVIKSVNRDNNVINQRIQNVIYKNITKGGKPSYFDAVLNKNVKKHEVLKSQMNDKESLKTIKTEEFIKKITTSTEDKRSLKNLEDVENGFVSRGPEDVNNNLEVVKMKAPLVESTTLLNASSITHKHHDTQKAILEFARPLPAPVLSVSLSQAVHYNVTWHGYTKPILAIAQVGRLGNTMGTYASLHAIAKIYNTNIFMLPEVGEDLKPIFPHLTMSPLPVPFVGGSWKYVGARANLTDYSSIQEAAAGLLGPRTFVVDDYPFEMQIFNAYRKEILEEFTFNNNLVKQARNFLQDAGTRTNQTKSKQPTFIGVHIRRTDYLRVLPRTFGADLPEEAYLHRALNFYRFRLENPIFIVASDDMDYAQDTLGKEPDVVMAPGSSAELDMCLLSQCRHSVMTVGSYGFWASYIAGGTVLYPDLKPRLKPFIFTKPYFQLAGLINFVPLEPY